MSPAATGHDQLRLDEVYLAGSTGHGPAVVGGLSLVADEQGLSVLGPQPSSVRTMPWGRVSMMSAGQMAPLPDGREAVALEVEIGGQALKFIVPAAALGPQGIGILESRLSSIAGMPVTATQPVTEPVALGTTAPGGAALGGAALGGTGVVPGAPSAGMNGSAAGGTAPPGVVPPGAVPPGVVMPGPVASPGAQSAANQGNGQVSVWAPPTGGTLLGGHVGSGQPYVHVGKKRTSGGKKLAFVTVLVVVLAAGGVFFEQKHKSSKTGQSADSLIAAGVNLNPGQVPGWKGISGTTAGVLGASGFKDGSGSQTASSGPPTVLASAASSFARCTKLPASESNTALGALGFSDGLGTSSGETALSSSPLFEDPAQTTTVTESSALVLKTPAAERSALSVFARPAFAQCYAHYLDSVVPDLVGGSASGIRFGFASVHAARRPSVESGLQTVDFSETIMKAGRTQPVALSGSIDVIGGGRTVAVLQTLTRHKFPAAMALKLFVSVEQNVEGESR